MAYIEPLPLCHSVVILIKHPMMFGKVFACSCSWMTDTGFVSNSSLS